MINTLKQTYHRNRPLRKRIWVIFAYTFIILLIYDDLSKSSENIEKQAKKYFSKSKIDQFKQLHTQISSAFSSADHSYSNEIDVDEFDDGGDDDDNDDEKIIDEAHLINKNIAKILTTKSNSALYEEGVHFYLNQFGRIRIISGSIHYFRLPHQLWKDRILKLKAVGGNTIATYVPWNLHEPRPHVWDFNPKHDLDLAGFLNLAMELGVFVILRIGPYIGGELDFGGLPAWLLNDPNMKVRSNYKGYLRPAHRYLEKIIEVTRPYMATTNDGPIIMIQLEQDYSNYEHADHSHIQFIANTLRHAGIYEKFITCDEAGTYSSPFHISPHSAHADIIDTLPTINFMEDTDGWFLHLLSSLTGKNRPIFVSELYTGRFNYWGETHRLTMLDDESTRFKYRETLEMVLEFNAGASINFYMFHEAINSGFRNGALVTLDKHTGRTHFKALANSYNDGALVTETGSFTDKFYIARESIAKELKHHHPPLDHFKDDKIAVFDPPSFVKYLKFEKMMDLVIDLQPDLITVEQHPILTERLKIHNNTGQSYGYTVYSIDFKVSKSVLKNENRNFVTLSGLEHAVLKDNIHICLLDGGKEIDDLHRLLKLQTYITVNKHERHLELNFVKLNIPDYLLNSNMSNEEKGKKNDNITLKLIMISENAGRSSVFDLNNQSKGISGYFSIDNNPLLKWTIIPMEFDINFIYNMNQQENENTSHLPTELSLANPGSYFFDFILKEEEIATTFIRPVGFRKGIIILNGRILGRYNEIGPQLTLYISEHWLTVGLNEVIVFDESFDVTVDILGLEFSDKHIGVEPEIAKVDGEELNVVEEEYEEAEMTPSMISKDYEEEDYGDEDDGDDAS